LSGIPVNNQKFHHPSPEIQRMRSSLALRRRRTLTPVRPRDRFVFLCCLEVAESASPLSVTAQPLAGHVGSMAMPLGPTCDCTLCDIEVRLLGSLAAVEGSSLPDLAESSQFRHHSSVSEILQILKDSPAGARSDDLLRELLSLRAVRPAFVESLLVLVFVPMLHRTIRRVARHRAGLAEEDITQQVLSILLQLLRSHDLQARQSHFAFAISRAVKRQAFGWARREQIKEALLSHDNEIFNPVAVEESFERYAQLRHFLHRCVTRGDLTDAELNLLIQFKLEGPNEQDFENLNGNTTNAVRQRLKRLLAKLRRLAR
jgi:hypothetical protein